MGKRDEYRWCNFHLACMSLSNRENQDEEDGLADYHISLSRAEGERKLGIFRNIFR